MKKQNVIIMFGVIMAAIVGIILIRSHQKRIRRRELDVILTAIESDKEGKELTLIGVKPDVNYNAEQDAIKLHEARGILWDDADAVFEVLRNKTKQQLAQLSLTYSRMYGIDLHEYLSRIFNTWLEKDSHERALNMINNAI